VKKNETSIKDWTSVTQVRVLQAVTEPSLLQNACLFTCPDSEKYALKLYLKFGFDIVHTDYK
jgi:hypothetical protein